MARDNNAQAGGCDADALGILTSVVSGSPIPHPVLERS